MLVARVRAAADGGAAGCCRRARVSDSVGTLMSEVSLVKSQPVPVGLGLRWCTVKCRRDCSGEIATANSGVLQAIVGATLPSGRVCSGDFFLASRFVGTLMSEASLVKSQPVPFGLRLCWCTVKCRAVGALARRRWCTRVYCRHYSVVLSILLAVILTTSCTVWVILPSGSTFCGIPVFVLLATRLTLRTHTHALTPCVCIYE